MAVIRGRAWLEWTGGTLTNVTRARFTMQLGTSPGVCTLEVPAIAAVPPRIVTLKIKGGGTIITFQDCAVVHVASERGNANDYTIEVQDRRWKWRDGYISGRYNVRESDGSIDTSTEKTPRELASLLLDELGESGYDVTALPNTTRPEVEWDFERPAVMLDQLLDPLGCDVSLGNDNVVRIVKIGTGDALPSGSVVRQSTGILPEPKPTNLIAVGPPIEFQERFELEAVGLDTDGSWQTLAALSYYPTGGFVEKINFSEITDETARRLAKRTVFKCYRLRQFAAGDLTLPYPSGSPLELNDASEIDLINGQTEYETVDGVKRRKLPVVRGNYTDEMGDNSVTSGKELDAPFTVDQGRRMIRFSRPIYKQSTTGAYQPADLYVDIAFRATDPAQQYVGQHVRGAFQQATTSPDNELDRVYELEDLQLKYRVPYTALTTRGTVVDNHTAMAAFASEYLDEKEAEFEADDPEQATYHGIIDQSTDGAIHTVRWSVGPPHPQTLITRNADPSNLPSRAKRRQILAQRKAQVRADRAERRRRFEEKRSEAR